MKIYIAYSLKPKKPKTHTHQKKRYNFFKKEIQFLPKTNTIVTLGKIAFDACLNFYKQDYDIKRKDFIFKHSAEYLLPDNKLLVGSYHPSPRNVNTGRIDTKKMVALLKKVKKIIER